MVMRKMHQEGMTTTSTVPISYQEIINRAAGEPIFRSQLYANPQKALSDNRYEMKQEDFDRLMNSMQKAKRIFNNKAYQLLEAEKEN